METTNFTIDRPTDHDQWWNSLRSVKAIVMPYCLQASITSPSATLPPGWAMKVTPNLDKWSILSRKGKKASDDTLTPSSDDRNAFKVTINISI